MITIPIQVSEDLAGRLLPHQDRLPEIIELGLRELEAQADAGQIPASKVRVLAALASTGIVTLPKTGARARSHTRRTPIQTGGPPASEMIIEARAVLRCVLQSTLPVLTAGLKNAVNGLDPVESMALTGLLKT